MRELQTPLLASFIVVAGLAACRNDVESPTTTPLAEVATTEATASSGTLVFRQVSAGGLHTCGVTAGDRAYCWGGNGSGQLGDGTTTQRLRPVAVAGDLRFKEVSAGARSTCGVTTVNEVFCWGDNNAFELGLGDGKPGFIPRPTEPVLGELSFKQVSVGKGRHELNQHVCALTTANVAYCWGNNTSGEVGNGSTICCATFAKPTRVAGELHFQTISAGHVHTGGLNLKGRAWCWGQDASGELGDGAHVNRISPTPVSGGLLFGQVSAAGETYFDPISGRIRGGYTCALSIENRAYCWGDDLYGQLGDDGIHSYSVPKRVVGERQFQDISAGPNHVCAVTVDDRAYCWGRNTFSELGDGTDAFRQRHPVAVVGGLHFVKVSAGDFHTCAVTMTGAAYCWGANANGQLGIGTIGTRPTPVAVHPPN